MGYQLIVDFRAGQDDRRSDVAAPTGTLRALTNAHINRGGEVEKRKALSSKYALPAGETTGLAEVDGALYVFGSIGSYATATIQVTSTGTGTNPDWVTNIGIITVDGVDISNSVIQITSATGLDTTANAIASAINNKTSIPNYTAVSDGVDTVTVTVDQAGAAPNGYTFTIPVTGSDPTLAQFSNTAFSGATALPAVPDSVNYQFLEHPTTTPQLYRVLSVDAFDGSLYVIAEYDDASIWHFYDGRLDTTFVDNRSRGSFTVGAGTTGTSTITSVTVDSIEILGQTVTYGATAAATAEAIGAAINSLSTVPNYTAVVQGAKVFVIAASAAGTDPDGFVVATTTSGITISGTANMAGGAVLASGEFLSGRFNRTFDTKMYVTGGPTLRFSKINDATAWQSTDTGAGSINMGRQASGSENLMALAEYYSFLAVFSRRNVQLWTMDPDEELNVKVQVLRNTGTYAPRSVESLGDGDVIYLSRTGVRSLKARDSSNVALASEIGAPLDNTIIAYAATLSAAEREAAIAAIEPIDNRYWLALGDKVFVLSLFAASKVAAWSEYDFGFAVSGIATVDDRLYARSGDTIYLFGGDDNATYDDSTVTVELPFADADTPATFKELQAIDATVDGEWAVSVAFNPKQPTVFDELGIVSGPTWQQPAAGAQGESTHFKFKLVHAKAEYARIANLAFHFAPTDAG
ncbi:MAG: hypothetical protein RJQ08_03865 [Salinisphaeraceae bacterium]